MGLSRGVTGSDLGFTGIPLAARGEWTLAEAGDPGRRVAWKGGMWVEVVRSNQILDEEMELGDY